MSEESEEQDKITQAREILGAGEPRGVHVAPFHDLRHTAASLMLERDVHPELVSEMLGHATITITLGVYSHVTPVMHREAANVMDDMLAGEQQ